MPSRSTIPDNRVFIVGASTLQNNFLALSLAEETGLSCYAVEGCAQARNQCEGLPDGEHVVLYDCMKRDMETSLQNLNPIVSNGNILACLFNVPKNTGMEENAMMKHGIRGFFYVDDSLPLLAKGVLAILEGEIWVSRRLLSDMVKRKFFSSRKRYRKILSAREEEILRLMAGGATNEEIADTFCVSKYTLRNQTHTIFQKLKVRGRVQAAIWAVKNLPSYQVQY